MQWLLLCSVIVFIDSLSRFIVIPICSTSFARSGPNSGVIATTSIRIFRPHLSRNTNNTNCIATWIGRTCRRSDRILNRIHSTQFRYHWGDTKSARNRTPSKCINRVQVGRLRRYDKTQFLLFHSRTISAITIWQFDAAAVLRQYSSSFPSWSVSVIWS